MAGKRLAVTFPASLPPRSRAAATSLQAQLWRTIDSYHFTDRERETINLVAQGFTNREISEQLKIDVSHVKSLVRTALAKIGCQEGVDRGSRIVHGRVRARTGYVNRLIDRATEVIGDHDQALRWLGTPVRALDYATPISLLGTKKGVARVEDVLGQMEHGIW